MALRGSAGGRRGRRFLGGLRLPVLSGLRLSRGAGVFRLARRIVSDGLRVSGRLCFGLRLIEHLPLRRMWLCAATEHFAPVQIEFFELRLQQHLLSLQLCLQFLLLSLQFLL